MEGVDDKGGHNAMDYVALAGLVSLTLWSAMNKQWWLIVVLALSAAFYKFKERQKAV